MFNKIFCDNKSLLRYKTFGVTVASHICGNFCISFQIQVASKVAKALECTYNADNTVLYLKFYLSPLSFAFLIM